MAKTIDFLSCRRGSIGKVLKNKALLLARGLNKSLQYSALKRYRDKYPHLSLNCKTNCLDLPANMYSSCQLLKQTEKSLPRRLCQNFVLCKT